MEENIVPLDSPATVGRVYLTREDEDDSLACCLAEEELQQLVIRITG